MSVVIPSLRGAIAVPEWAKNELWRKAVAPPSLDLRFADSKSLVDATTGSNLVTFTRASSGTFVDSAGVLQTAVTNLLLRSEEFDNASWDKQASVSVTANQTAAPNGATTADLITWTSASTNTGIYQAASGLGASVGCVRSIWIRADAAGGTVGLADPAFTSLETTVTLTTSWQRVQLTQNASAGGSAGVWVRKKADSPNTIYLWGAQLEQSSSVGEYIPTTSTINSAPRFDHNPTTGESLGLLVEEQRANLLLRSEAIATSPWFAGANTTLTNNTGEVLDPAGGSTATKVLVSGGTGAFGQAATLTAAIHTGSIWLRCSTGTISANLIVYLSGSPFTNIGTTNVTITTFWQRFTVVTSTATATAYNLQLNTIAVGTIYAWGAQLEAGAFPTSYIPTTTATVTRSADVASITGSAFSGFYNQSEGTLFVNATVPQPSGGNRRIAFATDGTGNNRIGVLFNASNNPQMLVSSGGTTFASDSIAAVTATGPVSIAAAYKADNFGLSANGSASTLDASGSVPSTIDRLSIGSSDGGDRINGTIRRLSYWATRLASSTLQTLTQ